MNYGILKYINLPIFSLSFVIGVIAVYIMGQNQKRKIYVYPTPETIDALQYKDHANNCFTVKHTNVKCPIDAEKINVIPVAT